MSTQKKFVREGRMGPPFSYKTGAVVESYPKPLLVLEFDIGGLDVVKQPIERIEPQKIREYSNGDKPVTPILAIEFDTLRKRELDLTIKSYDSIPALNFKDVVDSLVKGKCPWKTIVVDPITGLTEAFVGYIGVTDSAAMNDARQWAHKAGILIQRTIMVIQGLPCHTVFLMHCDTDKNEITGEITTDPMVPSKLRQRLASLFSQFFYAAVEGGKAVVYTQPSGFVKGVGMRKPDLSRPKLGALFLDIYGEEYK